MDKPNGHPIKDAIRQEEQARRDVRDQVFDARTKVITDSLKDLGGLLKKETGRLFSEVIATLKEKWDQGRDELAKAILGKEDGYMPWPEHDKQEAAKVEARDEPIIAPVTPYVPKAAETEKQKPLTM